MSTVTTTTQTQTSVDIVLDGQVRTWLIEATETALHLRTDQGSLVLRLSDLAALAKLYTPLREVPEGFEIRKRPPQFGEPGYVSRCTHHVPCIFPCCDDD